MLPVCTPSSYKRFRFPACSDLVFQTNLLSQSLTLRLYNYNTGYCEFTKSTDSEGKFTLLLSDLEAEAKAFILNPWIGFFKVEFIYDGQLYEQFYTEQGEVVYVELQAQRWAVPPASYYFYQFRFILDDTDALPDGDSTIWNNSAIWNNSELYPV